MPPLPPALHPDLGIPSAASWLPSLGETDRWSADERWLNLVQCWFALLTRRRLERGVVTSTQALEEAIRAYLAANNADPKPFVLTRSADTMCASVARYCQRTSNSDH